MYRGASLRFVLSVACVTAFSAPAVAQVVPTGKVATFDGQGANAWSGNIRASDDELVALLEDGIEAVADLQGSRRSSREVRRHSLRAA